VLLVTAMTTTTTTMVAPAPALDPPPPPAFDGAPGGKPILIEDDDAVWGMLQALCSDAAPASAAAPAAAPGNPDDASCPHCRRAHAVVLDDGNYVCTHCGTVVDRFIDLGAEWRFYGFDDGKADPTRCGLPVNELLPQSSMGCLIGYTTNESSDMRMIRKYHMWNSMTYKERSLYGIFDTLTVNAVTHGIPKAILEEAKAMYKRISEMKISRGDNRSGLIASSIYMSCKTNKVPRSAKEIAKIFNLKPTVMTKGCKRFQELMRVHMVSSQPEDFISRFCSKLALAAHQHALCSYVVRQADHHSVVSENTPPSIAAGSIQLCNLACHWGIPKKDLADACEISQVTVTKCTKKLLQHARLLLPEEVCARYGIDLDGLLGGAKGKAAAPAAQPLKTSQCRPLVE
jgi:transcription initiation factor TFIIB